MEEAISPELEKACKEYLRFAGEQSYSKENFVKGAEYGLEILREAGGWEEANRALRKTWIQSNGDHFEELRSSFFEGLVDEKLLERARQNAAWGIDANYHGERGPRVRCGPHPSLKEHVDEAAQQLWRDAGKGRALLCFDQGQPELEGVISVAMARVPKMLPDRTVSSKGRVIWDATPVNHYCHKSRHPPALQPRHEEVTKLIIWWQTRYPGVPIFLAKKDVSDAFKWIPIRGPDTRLFAADLPGKEFGVPGTITVVYNSLTFGWCGAPGEYMLFAWLAKLGHAAYEPEDPTWHDTVPFKSMVLMDDTILIEPALGIRPWMSVETAERCIRAALGPDTLNDEKDAVEGALETRKLIWGLYYDTATGTRTLPPVKLEKAAYLLHLPEFDHGNTRVPLRLVQELRGNQQFWVSVLPSLKPLLCATNALLGPPTHDGFVQPRGTPEQQRHVWYRFWEAVELQRLLVDNRQEWGVRFTHPMVEALTVREILALPGGGDRIIWASGDATLDRVGAVDWTHKEAYSLGVEPYKEVLREMEAQSLEDLGCPRRDSRPDVEGEGEEKLMVALTELLALLLLAVHQHEKWKGKIVLYMGDNQVVIAWLNSKQAKHPLASYMLQTLAAIEASHGFFVHSAYLRTYHNVVADALTRQDAAEVMESAQLTRLPPPDKALQKFLDRGWQRRALVWAGQPEAEVIHALRLSEVRGTARPPVKTPTIGLLGICFEDLSSPPVWGPEQSAWTIFPRAPCLGGPDGNGEGSGGHETPMRDHTTTPSQIPREKADRESQRKRPRPHLGG